MEISNIQLIEKLRNGENDAYEYIFTNYYAALCVYARKYLREVELAEEMVQDVIYKLWEKRESLELHTSVKSYLFSAVRNTSLNHLKHKKIEENYQKEMLENSSTKEESYFDALVSNEIQGKITKAISNLPEQCRKIFELSRFEGLRHKEIADKLEISTKTVEGQITKAIKLLKEYLKDYIYMTIPVATMFFSFFK